MVGQIGQAIVERRPRLFLMENRSQLLGKWRRRDPGAFYLAERPGE